MRAIAQFTIINFCDVISSDVAPENPYIGMLWVNTATVPPETMVWDGLGWVVQNNLEELRTTVSTHTTRFGEFQTSIDGLFQTLQKQWRPSAVKFQGKKRLCLKCKSRSPNWNTPLTACLSL